MAFEFNIAFTSEVNKPGSTDPLSPAELWQGIKRGGRNPNDFADYVASCEVLSGRRKEFRRRLTIADGAVHTAKGKHLDQDVLIADNLHVRKGTRPLDSHLLLTRDELWLYRCRQRPWTLALNPRGYSPMRLGTETITQISI